MQKSNIKILIISIIIIFFSSYSFAYDTTSSYIWSVDSDTITTSSSNIEKINSETENNNSLNLESGAAILIEQSTGQVLYALN